MTVSITAAPGVRDAGNGVFRIDFQYHRPMMGCCYLLESDGDWAFIDSGTATAAPGILLWMETNGIALDAVRWIIPTHVHLDHAGGAGVLAAACPNARVAVHPRGARHMIDPAKLIAGAQAVYDPGQFDRDHAGMQPIDASRVVVAEDGMTLEFGRRPLQIIDSPGHAAHHLCVWDAQSRAWFTGDTFGISYREFDVDGRAWVMPTTSPVQFDPEAWLATLGRLLIPAPECMWLTHFDGVGDVPQGADMLAAGIGRYRDIALRHADAGPETERRIRADLTIDVLADLQRHGCGLTESRILELLDEDLELNAQGLAVWLERIGRSTPH